MVDYGAQSAAGEMMPIILGTCGKEVQVRGHKMLIEPDSLDEGLLSHFFNKTDGIGASDRPPYIGKQRSALNYDWQRLNGITSGLSVAIAATYALPVGLYNH